MKMRKALLALCALVLVFASVAGTLAYFTDSEAVTNTFTVGKVKITLDESKVNTDGAVVAGADRVMANTYHLIPGMTYDKDPTVHVEANSEDAYIFVKVVNPIAGVEAAVSADVGTIDAQIKANGWTVFKTEGNTTIYCKEHTKTAGQADYPVFAQFKIDGEKVVNTPDSGETVPAGTVDIATFHNAQIVITAYAIQKAGFDSAAEAWTAGNFQ